MLDFVQRRFASYAELSYSRVATARNDKLSYVYLGTAFERCSSIVLNAKRHYGNRSSLVLDIKNAFASIEAKHIYRCFKMFLPDDLAWVMSRVFTYRGRLRQGPSASPQVFNLVMKKFDLKIARSVGAPIVPSVVCEYNKRKRMIECNEPRPTMVYTRYGDDLCFSSPKDHFPREIEECIRASVKEAGFRLNQKRMLGAKGVLRFPGVVMVNGCVQPDDSALERFASAILEFGENSKVVNGYKSYLQQFPRSGRRAAYKTINYLLSLSWKS